MKLTYGYTIEPHKQDPLVQLADKALEQFSAAAVPATWLVDSIPACQLHTTHLDLSNLLTACSAISPRLGARGGFPEDSPALEGNTDGTCEQTYGVCQEEDGRA